MSNDVVAGLVVTVVALVAMYLWLAVCDVARSLAERRRWRNARSSASTHFDFQPETHNTHKEHTS